MIESSLQRLQRFGGQRGALVFRHWSAGKAESGANIKIALLSSADRNSVDARSQQQRQHKDHGGHQREQGQASGEEVLLQDAVDTARCLAQHVRGAP